MDRIDDDVIFEWNYEEKIFPLSLMNTNDNNGQKICYVESINILAGRRITLTMRHNMCEFTSAINTL